MSSKSGSFQGHGRQVGPQLPDALDVGRVVHLFGAAHRGVVVVQEQQAEAQRGASGRESLPFGPREWLENARKCSKNIKKTLKKRAKSRRNSSKRDRSSREFKAAGPPSRGLGALGLRSKGLGAGRQRSKDSIR